MKIDSEFVKSVGALAAVADWKVAGPDGEEHTYTSKPVYELKPAPPALFAKVNVHTLAGFGDLVNARIDRLDPDDFFVQVEDEAHVSLQAKLTDLHGRRLELITASPLEFEAFRFGQFIDHETFVIQVAAKFCATPDKDYVLQMASTLTTEAIGTAEDNGFTQRATVKAGMKVAESILVKPQVDLAPFRTFPELAQPVSPFVFRAKQQNGSPALMLVEADGGAWKLAAMQEIRNRILSMDLGCDVIA